MLELYHSLQSYLTREINLYRYTQKYPIKKNTIYHEFVSLAKSTSSQNALQSLTKKTLRKTWACDENYEGYSTTTQHGIILHFIEGFFLFALAKESPQR